MHDHASPIMMTRSLRSLYALFTVVVSFLLLSQSTSASAADPPAYAYATLRSGAIQTFQIFSEPGNPSDRALVPSGSLQLPAGMFPLAIKLSHSGQFAYILTDGKPHILTYAVNRATGALTLQGMVETTLPTGGFDIGIDDQFLYMASSGASDAIPGAASFAILWFAIDLQTGTLRLAGTLDLGTAPADLKLDSTGKFLYVTLKNRNAVGMFRLDDRGRPMPLNPSTVRAGTNPLPIALNSVYPFLHVGNISNGDVGTVWTYQIKPDGTLTPLWEVHVGKFPGAIKVHPSGRFMYVANATSNSLMVFKFNTTTGEPTWVQTMPTGRQPEALAIDSSGTALYVPEYLDNVAAMHRIDQNTGELTPLGIGRVPAGVHPNDMVTSPSPGPTLTLSLNQTLFHPGETLYVWLRAQNPGTAISVDFYFGVLLPDGETLLFFTADGIAITRLDADPRTFQPLFARANFAPNMDITVPDFLVYTFSGAESPRVYQFLAFLTPPEAFADGRVDSSDLLTLAVAPFSFSP